MTVRNVYSLLPYTQDSMQLQLVSLSNFVKSLKTPIDYISQTEQFILTWHRHIQRVSGRLLKYQYLWVTLYLSLIST